MEPLSEASASLTLLQTPSEVVHELGLFFKKIMSACLSGDLQILNLNKGK
jgi:hypothetical protein